MGEVNERMVGKHRLCFEPPYIFVGHLVGDVTAEEMIQIVAAIIDFAANKPGVLAMFDLSAAGSLLPGSRRPVATAGPYLRGSAIIGASYSMELVASLLSRAFALVTPGSDNPIEFFKDEKQARAWLAQRQSLIKPAS